MPIERKVLEDLRRRLLDIGKRNRLINFRFSESSRNHLRIVDELPNVIHSRLVDEKPLYFGHLVEPDDEPEDEHTDIFLMALEAARSTDEDYLKEMVQLVEDDDTSAAGLRIERELKDKIRSQLSMPERPSRDTLTPAQIATNLGLKSSYDLPFPKEQSELDDAHVDDKLQTLLFPDQLERKLSGINDGARNAFSEMGVNILFVAIGYLEWYESGSSDQKLFAPLLLHPLAIQRTIKKQRYEYSIKTYGEDTESNHTLRERLQSDFGLVLPEYDVASDTPESYFQSIAQVIQSQKRWKVRRFVTVGLFPFSKIAMYHDLDPAKWPESPGLLEHPVLSDLLSISMMGDSLHPEEHDIDTIESGSESPLLIADADSSQHATVVDVLKGKNLAVKGPPGTGKSQTITNVIAAAMAQGLKVLFIAEKMAALDVVKNRLDHAGIGVFSLELHSTKANKKDVLQSLRDRLDLATKSTTQCRFYKNSLTELETLRSDLSSYVELLNQPFGKTAIRLHEIIWSAIKYQQQGSAANLPASVYEIFFGNTCEWTPSDVENRRIAVLSLQEKCEELERNYGPVVECPFWGIRCPELTRFEEEQLRDTILSLHNNVTILDEAQLRLSQSLCSPVELSLSVVENTIKAIGLTLRAISMKDVLSRTRSENDRDTIRRCMERLGAATRLEHFIFSKLDAEDIDTIPALEDLTSIDTIRSRMPRGCPRSNGSSEEFKQCAREYGNAGVQLKEQVEGLLGKIGKLEFGLPVTNQLLRSLLKAKKILEEVDRNTLLYRDEALYSEQVRPELKKAAERCAKLKSEQNGLSEILRFSLDEEPSTYRDYARTLRSASFLERIFGKKFRIAKKFWLGSCVAEPKKDTHAIASVFDEVAGQLEGVHGFTTDTSIAAFCGTQFHGLDTDFSTLLRVNKFALYLHQVFPGSDDHIRVVREFLLTAEMSELDRLKVVFDDEDTRTATYLVQVCKKLYSSANPVELTDLPTAFQDIGNWATEMYESMVRLQFKPETSSGDLASIINAIEERLSCKSALYEDAAASDLLGCPPLEFLGKTETLHMVLETSRNLVSMELPDDILTGILRMETSEEVLRNVESECQHAKELILEIESVKETKLPQANVDATEFFSKSQTVRDLSERLTRVVEAIGTLPLWATFCTVEKRCGELSMGSLIDWYYDSGAPAEHLRVAFEVALSRSLMQDAYKIHPELKRFSGTTQEAARARFLAIDRKFIDIMQSELQATLSGYAIPRGVNSGLKKEWTNLALIQNELSKKQRHIPVRDLFRRAGDAIQQMKPCWLMSPASVAQFLSPGDVEFDLVLIDEASQMLPEDAVGAIARSKQAVIVGDPMQLPPTSFFSKIDNTPQDDEDYEEFVDSESVLDRALSAFHPSRTLHWHYRSRHDSLIAFSNKHFYNGDLVLFPSREHEARVELVKVDGVYTPGKRVNFREIEVVANSVITFMCDHPNLSLGVVTMNQSQREILLDEIDRLFTRNPSVEAYLSKWEKSLERFFVKNLENVQGDERDVIFISTVYGPQEPGGKVAQRFGPINSEGGHRRLNVLFTRAKERVVVFSSMTSSDILAEGKKRGVGILKDYLEYAETGKLSLGSPSGRAPDSDFEIHVANRLTQLGYEVDAQVGSAGYFIDLAVREPGKTNRYIVGIECDGANYHSAKSTRDRDRLRQEILENLGWKIYRIWSTDWFNNPDGEIQKLEKYISRLKSSA